MPEDEIAVYRPALREILEGGEGWCATFSDEDDESAWVQVLDGQLNFAYPYKVEPQKLLGKVGVADLESLEVVSWEPGKYATFRLTQCEEGSLSLIVDQVFTKVLDRVSGFRIAVELFKAD